MAIDIMGIPNITKMVHVVDLPMLCPHTKNPCPGSTITIEYKPEGKAIEVYSLQEYINSFIEHQEVRDIEVFTFEVAQHVADTLGVLVTVKSEFILNIGQTVICECQI